MTSLAQLAGTVRLMAAHEPTKAAFRGRPSQQDMAMDHLKEAARVLELLDEHTPRLRAALGNVLPWEKSAL